MHQHAFSQGLSAFFQCLAHGFGADAVHYLAFHQPVCQQLQRPGGPALRRLGAGQGNQLGFIMAVQLLGAAVQLLLRPRALSRPSSTQRRRTRSTVAVPTWRARAISSSFMGPLAWFSSQSSRMRAWVCL